MKINLRLGCVMLLLVMGCRSGKQIVQIKGVATRAGKPVSGLTLHFYPKEGRPSWGESNDKGEFGLSYDPQRNGAEVGPHKVWVEFRGGGVPGETGGRTPEQKAILAKYGNREQPAIDVTIEKANQLVEIKLDD